MKSKTIKNLILFAIFALMIVLGACNGTGTIQIIEDGKTEYTLVYPYTSNLTSDIENKEICEKAAEKIKTVTGATVKVVSEKDSKAADEDAKEIVIGNTSKFPFAKTELNALSDTGYMIKTEGNRIFVTGNNKASGQAGVDFIIDFFFNAETKVMSIPTGYVTVSHIPVSDVPAEIITEPSFTYGPTVFAVGDEYQIIYHTNTKGIAWAEIDGKKYYDEYGGFIRSESLNHKITIPMEILDSAKKYSIHFAPVYERKPYSPEKGTEIKRIYDFRPVDTSDGVQIYSVADSHSNTVNCSKTAKYYGDKLDLLVLCGDINSESTSLEKLYDISVIAFKITEGKIPVVYARGNHEIRGQVSELIGDYVGTNNGDLFYTFRLGSLWGVVLDCGEDKADDHKEYGGMVAFDNFRKAQTEFLKEIVANADSEYNAEGVEQRIAICHIPFPAKENYAPAPGIYHEWTALLSKMDIDMMLSGHHHKTEICESGSISENQNFPVIIGSSSNRKINDSEKDNEFIATAVEYLDDKVTVSFTNINHGVESSKTWELK